MLIIYAFLSLHLFFLSFFFFLFCSFFFFFFSISLTTEEFQQAGPVGDGMAFFFL